MSEPTFYGMINSAIEDGMSPEEAADLVLATNEFQDKVRTMLVARVRNLMRLQNRQAEHRAEEAWREGNLATARKELVGRSFALPDGRFVDWGTASATEHRARALWQSQRAQAIQRDATLHAVAAEVIEQAGVSCLNEIESLAPWPELSGVLTSIEAG